MLWLKELKLGLLDVRTNPLTLPALSRTLTPCSYSYYYHRNLGQVSPTKRAGRIMTSVRSCGAPTLSVSLRTCNKGIHIFLYPSYLLLSNLCFLCSTGIHCSQDLNTRLKRAERIKRLEAEHLLEPGVRVKYLLFEVDTQKHRQKRRY